MASRSRTATTRRARAAARARAEIRQEQRRKAQRAHAEARRRSAVTLATITMEKRIRARCRAWVWRGEIREAVRSAARVLGGKSDAPEAKSHALQLYEHLARHAPRLLTIDEIPLFRALIQAQSEWGWVRPIAEWKPLGRSTRRLRESLVDHLLFLYPVPQFLKSALFEVPDGDFRGHRQWTAVAIAIGRGESLVRKRREGRFPFLPSLTRAIVREFLAAPSDLSPWHAVRRGQIVALGGQGEAVTLLEGTALAGPVEEEDRWTRALAWWVGSRGRFPECMTSRWVDFVVAQFDRSPTWSLARRSPSEVERQIRNWEKEEQLRRLRAQWAEVFPESNLEVWRTETCDALGHRTRWWFRQIRTGGDLYREGERMDHCVYSYRGELRRREAEIWSLSRDGDPVLTIEVADREVVEVKGRFNRVADWEERDIIGQWASRNQLRVDEDAHDF